jgi:NAD+ kinase
MSGLRAVGLVPHRDRPLAHTLAQAAAAWFAEHSVEVRILGEEAQRCGLPHLATPPERFAEGLDLAIALGGDGTMLHSVQLVYRAGVPLLGVNAGQLGYLAALEPAEFDPALARLLVGDYRISERMMLEVAVTSAGAERVEYALNEAVLEKRDPGHLVRFELAINGTPFTSYAADGVIVATATGSTAYSFSARGPIASPRLRCLMLTPISAHMLFDRSLVLSDDEELSFVVGGPREVSCTVDGRAIGVLVPGDRVVCRAATDPLRLVELSPRDFHQILKTKFNLADR